MSPADGRTRVLHFSEALGGGVASALETYIRRTGDEVEHVVLARRRPGHDVGDSLESSTKFIPLPGNQLAALRTLRRVVREERPDVVHAHSSYAGLWARLGLRSVPVIYTPHCFAFERTDVRRPLQAIFRLAERVQVRRTALFMPVGTREEQLCREMSTTVPVVAVPCTPIDLRDFIDLRDRGEVVSQRHDAARAITPQEPLVVATVGRVMAQKDPAWFADVARAVGRDEIRFVWLGGGEPTGEALLRTSGVEVTGWLSRSDVLRRLRDVDVYLHPAAWEGNPVSVMEAALTGLPVVARSIAAFEGTGFRTVSDTAEAVAVLRQLRDPQRRVALARRSANALASLERTAREADLANVYRTVGRKAEAEAAFAPRLVVRTGSAGAGPPA